MEDRIASALFLDYDNLVHGVKEISLDPCPDGFVPWALLVREIERLHPRVTIRRAYGDFMFHARRVFEGQNSEGRARWLVGEDLRAHSHLLALGFEMLYSPPLGRSTKNRADLAIGLDVLEVAHAYPHVRHVVLATGDSDLSPVVLRLRALGRTVSVLATDKNLSGLLRSLADDVILIDSGIIDRFLRDPVRRVVEGWLATETGPERLRDGVIPVSALSQALREKVPGVEPGNFGQETWKRVFEGIFDDSSFALPEGGRIRLEIGGDRIRMATPAAPISAGSDGHGLLHETAGAKASEQSRPAASPPPIMDRRQVLLAALNRKSMNPYPDVRQRLLDWLRKELAETPRTSLAALLERTAEALPDTSKRRIREAMQALKRAGAFIQPDGRPLELDQQGGWHLEAEMCLDPDGAALERRLIGGYLRLLMCDERLATSDPFGGDDLDLACDIVFGRVDAEERQQVQQVFAELSRAGDSASDDELPPVDHHLPSALPVLRLGHEIPGCG
jgi:hypothetical protein